MRGDLPCARRGRLGQAMQLRIVGHNITGGGSFGSKKAAAKRIAGRSFLCSDIVGTVGAVTACAADPMHLLLYLPVHAFWKKSKS